MPPRKRRRSQAFAPDEVVQDAPPEPAEEEEEEEEEEGVPDSQAEDEQEELKDGVWETFREQHHEAVEILPLTLHRNYGLLRELDQQAEGYMNALLPTARAYISHRRSLRDAYTSTTTNGTDSMDVEPTEAAPLAAAPATPVGPQPKLQLESLSKSVFRTPKPRRPPLARVVTPMTPVTPIALPPERTKEPQSSREMLSHIAWITEDLLRNSQEKVNLAQSCVELVDRQVRLVEQAIRDQELVIAHEVRPGTHPAPIVLADITAPQKYTRPTRVSFSPIRSFHDYVDPPDGLSEDVDILNTPAPEEPPEFSEEGKKGRKGQAEQKKSVIIRIPARPSSADEPRHSSVATEDDPAEAIWCYCKMPESQDRTDRPMVACDNDDCEWGWFHLECLNLKVPPSGAQWYCPTHEHMATLPSKPTKKRTRRRRKG